ncbi:hypothetical protein ACHAXT_012186 [Thalassiosira profunda]
MARARSRRKAASDASTKAMNLGEYDEDGGGGNDKTARGQMKWRFASSLRAARYILGAATSAKLSAAAMISIVTSIFIDGDLKSFDMKCGVGYLFVVRPLMSTLAIVCGAHNPTPTARIIASAFLLSIVCTQLPKWLSAVVAYCAILAFGLASRQLVSHQSQSTANHVQSDDATNFTDGTNFLQRTWSRLGLKERAALGGIAVVASLLTENFIIWVVSATYQPGIEGFPEPLQDNGRIVLEKLAMLIYNVDAPWKAKRALQTLRDALNVQWALVSSLGASLVCLELQLDKSSDRTLAGLALRALMTLASARLIRTISFVLTVLPSQVRNCYASHFPPPPEEWGAWLMVGFLPNSRGGCNDLILSGHATITSTVGCAFTSAAANASFSIAVWTLIALDYGIESYQGLHYSVDMWLGCIVTCLLWQLTKPLEVGGVQEQTHQRENARKGNGNNAAPLDAATMAKYTAPAVVGFVVLTMVPEAFVNYFLVGYSTLAAVLFARNGFTNFLQHLLMCELCLGLGAYL